MSPDHQSATAPPSIACHAGGLLHERLSHDLCSMDNTPETFRAAATPARLDLSERGAQYR
jgi:hypothetical protein